MTTRRELQPLEGYHPEVGLLLAMLDNATDEWKMDLDTVRAEAIPWRPAPNLHSIGAVILHIAAVEVFWLYKVLMGRDVTPEEWKLLQDDELDQDGELWPEAPNQPLSWFFEQHDRVRARTRETLREITDPNTEVTYNDRVFTFRWLMSHVINHEAYHGGQVVLLQISHDHICPA